MPASQQSTTGAQREGSGLRGRFAFGYLQSLGPDEVMDFDAIAAMKARHFAGGPSGLLSLSVSARGPDRSVGPVWRA